MHHILSLDLHSTPWNQFSRFPLASSNNTAVNNTSVPGLLTGEGGRKLAGMDLRRSFCSASMKGSFKCSEAKTEREQRQHITRTALWMKAQRWLLSTCTRKEPFLVLSECTFINASVWLTPPPQLDLCQGYQRWCFTVWVWYFSWIAEYILNVGSFNCSFLGHKAKAACVPTYQLTLLLSEKKRWRTAFSKAFLQTLINGHTKGGPSPG